MCWSESRRPHVGRVPGRVWATWEDPFAGALRSHPLPGHIEPGCSSQAAQSVRRGTGVRARLANSGFVPVWGTGETLEPSRDSLGIPRTCGFVSLNLLTE